MPQAHISKTELWIAKLSRPRKSMNAALLNEDLFRVRQIVTDDAKASLIGTKAFSKALHIAVKQGDRSLTSLLLEKGADAEASLINTEAFSKALHIAAE